MKARGFIGMVLVMLVISRECMGRGAGGGLAWEWEWYGHHHSGMSHL